MNKNTIIGSVLIGAIMIWWFFMNSANNEAAERAKLAQKAAAKEAAAQVADSAEAPSANGLVLPGSTAELKAAPVLGAAAPATDKVAEPAEVTAASDSSSNVIANEAKQSTADAAPKPIAQRTVTVETDKFIMTLSNKGGKVQSVIVKALPDTAKQFPELIQDTTLGALDLKVGGADLSEVLFDVDAPEWINVDSDTSVQFVFTDANGNQLVRSYAFTKDGAAVRQVNKFKGFRVDNYELSWKGGMRETESIPKGKTIGVAGYFFSEVIYKNSEITERETFSDAMTFDEAKYYWVGLRRKYVAMSVQFDKPVPAKVKAKHIKVGEEDNPDPGTYSISIADDVRGDSVAYNFMVLPLQWDEVESLGQGYEKIIVTGSKWFPGSSVWFVWICKWLLKLLKFFYSIIPNYGVAIILVTFIVRGFTTPFTIKQLKSTSAMSKLKPQLDEINVKYRSDPAKKQAAVMELYSKNGVNPLASCTGGCLPMIIQMPIFIGLFYVLGRAVELRGMPAFLWITDLSRSDVIFHGFSIPFIMPDGFALLPWIMLVTTYFQTKVTMVGNGAMDPAQQKMMTWMMPAMFFVFSAVMPSGLVLYWIVSNIWSIVQYKIIRRDKGNNGPKTVNGKKVVDAEIVK
ncbi:YidC/Oxa1 family insertase periplasmic-domain containing protein [uncultured Fibrobacter sp.]|uniref:YidC/Oxa1 family insertase periplasmic-domain containing protein n=1 Tax=uncultured Fibrobacter sp. TaxID=261512 RepID=UPI00261824FB|nr:YidC/Oxa1 family insertase periplasmic-domain containing protein [uncultured Fibrobacter sp.]